MNNNIIIIGDVHGEWKHLNVLINKKNPKIILSTGDFGYWPNFNGKTIEKNKVYSTNNRIKKEKWHQCNIKNKDTKIYFCDGNHEDHWSLKKLENNEICPNIFYMKRGSILELNDKNILFFGGAKSIDQYQRTIGIDWFPEETISYQDIENIPDSKIDIVISHTCPEEFLPFVIKKDLRKINDPCYKALSYILNYYKPKFWYFSHFHINAKGFTNGCRWFCLNIINKTMGWRNLI